MEFIRGIDLIKEDLSLPDRLVTARFNTLLTRSAHRWYIKLRQAHGHQSWTWWKTQIIKKWANDSWRFEVETAFESLRFNTDKDTALPWFCQQKDRLTTLYPAISELMINIKIQRQCGADLEHSVKRSSEKSSAEDIISILENTKENSNNIQYKSADAIRKCHILQSTTHLANACPRKGNINEINIEKEPTVEKDDVIEDNSDDKSSIFSESSKDIEYINATFDIMESHSHLQ
ncbi:hypothetical protein O181_096854 [Austropuccinia psidii MF-1]|uniref:Retrotransposon gag domain-containing protein n=1 Tax=Austropuccinia psidii MF-1 TaxID=1389203 RepID=A0A9Q3J842_9BASI|nr:hypothetical protein [Austropuccinia psidii MF-1]